MNVHCYSLSVFLRAGLGGENALEMLESDAIVDTLNDMVIPIHVIYREDTTEKVVSELLNLVYFIGYWFMIYWEQAETRVDVPAGIQCGEIPSIFGLFGRQ